MIVWELWRDEDDEYGGDARVMRLTGRSGLLKQPRRAGVIPLHNFKNGRMKPFDPERGDPWTRAINERYGYDPPRSQSDPRVCGRCHRAWGSVLVVPREGHFSVFNWRTGKYHSGVDGGDTACGQDATGGEWLWPI